MGWSRAFRREGPAEASTPTPLRTIDKALERILLRDPPHLIGRQKHVELHAVGVDGERERRELAGGGWGAAGLDQRQQTLHRQMELAQPLRIGVAGELFERFARRQA